MTEGQNTCVVRTKRGLDEHGIPAALFLATVRGLGDRGHGVGVCIADSQEELDMSSDDSFYGSLLRDTPRALTLTVAGPRAKDVAQGFLALVDECATDILRAVGMAVEGPKCLTWVAPPSVAVSPDLFWITHGKEGEPSVCLQGTGIGQRIVVRESMTLVAVGQEIPASLLLLMSGDEDDEATQGSGSGVPQTEADGATASCRLVCRNRLGVHSRPITLFVSRARKFDSTITVMCDGACADGKSPLGLYVLAIGYRAEFRIMAEGDDAAEALEALTKLVNDGFGEG